MSDPDLNTSTSSGSDATTGSNLAICLSGGGYRAALFHLGAMRRLNELGVLGKVTMISSVSGGSILAAHLARQFVPERLTDGRIRDWDENVAQPFRAFCRRDIRTWPILKRFLLPWNWLRRSTQVVALAKKYQKYLTAQLLTGLPESPVFTFCATDVMHGVNWTFRRDRVGDYKAHFRSSPSDWPVARAVAASSCFPPLFDPMPVGEYLTKRDAKDGKSYRPADKGLSQVRLSDGGVYDNLGLDPTTRHRCVLVSDGGAPIRTFKPSSFPLALWVRYFDIASNQVGSLRKRWLMADFLTNTVRDGREEPIKTGTYWGIGSGSTDKDHPDWPGYDDALAEYYISKVRTDLDKFTFDEMGILENHGYLLANRVVQKRADYLVPDPVPSLEVPYPDLLDVEVVREALKRSHRRFCPSRTLRG